MIEYIFPISYGMICFFKVIDFNLKTCNVEYSEYCESYGAGVYHLSKLCWCFNGNIGRDELAVEKK